MRTRLSSVLLAMLAVATLGSTIYLSLPSPVQQPQPPENFQYDDRVRITRGFHEGVYGRIVAESDDPDRMLVELNERGDRVLVRKDSMYIHQWNKPRHRQFDPEHPLPTDR